MDGVGVKRQSEEWETYRIKISRMSRHFGPVGGQLTNNPWETKE